MVEPLLTHQLATGSGEEQETSRPNLLRDGAAVHSRALGSLRIAQERLGVWAPRDWRYQFL